MDPVFKIVLKETVESHRLTSNIIRDEGAKHLEAVIEMGDRKIVFRTATGEQGEEGPFPFVEVLEDGGSKAGYCLTHESQFEYLWRFLEAGCR